jgi:lysophospholipase L1-like esterase
MTLWFVLKSVRLRLLGPLGLVIASVAASSSPARAQGCEPGRCFEPIALQRIDFPSSVKQVSDPAFTEDGKHVLFWNELHLWIVGTDGKGLKCLSCGLANEPKASYSEGQGQETPFPDGKRIFIAVYGTPAVLECAPSVVDCANRKIMPIDLSGARPGSNGQSAFTSPPGGADLTPAVDVGGAASPKLSPDGNYIAFSDIRSDAVELMILARLTRTATGYVTSDPRVLNPQGPSSPFDTNLDAWSRSTALFEFKSFAAGGASATYVQAGGDSNIDIWKVNLQTGQRTRLTANPDWDEDNAPSLDGQSLLDNSNRTMHRTDMVLGLLPYRSFFTAPGVAGAAFYYVGSAQRRECQLVPWLLPAKGDDNARLLGQPIQPYTGGPIHPANDINGFPQWSPDSTEIALATQDSRTDLSAPYLMIARLTSRKPTTPRIVSSAPGSWAPSPTDYHGGLPADTSVTVHGLASGTATLTSAGAAGILGGSWSVTYNNYSDDGRDFINGTARTDMPNVLTGPIHEQTHIVMTGADTGRSDIDITWGGQNSPSESGSAVTTFDGTTVKGPPVIPGQCPNSFPKVAPLQLATKLIEHRHSRFVRMRVSARYFGAGRNEASWDARPVFDAVVMAAGRRTTTNQHGIALLRLPGNSTRIRVRVFAGDTFSPTALLLKARATPNRHPETPTPPRGTAAAAAGAAEHHTMRSATRGETVFVTRHRDGGAQGRQGIEAPRRRPGAERPLGGRVGGRTRVGRRDGQQPELPAAGAHKHRRLSAAAAVLKRLRNHPAVALRRNGGAADARSPRPFSGPLHAAPRALRHRDRGEDPRRAGCLQPARAPAGPGNAWLTVSFYVPGTYEDSTYHSSGMTTSYSTPSDGGDQTTDASGTSYTTPTIAWTYLTGVDVRARRRVSTIVALGDSITDCCIEIPDSNMRWPGLLDQRLATADGGQRFSVVNAGISGNDVSNDRGGNTTQGAAGDTCDVFAEPNVSTVILFEGINDVGTGVEAAHITAAYQKILADAHARGIRVLICMLTPSYGSVVYGTGYTTNATVRDQVNSWILTHVGLFDGLIDFASVVANPADPDLWNPAYNVSDQLHPNELGLKAKADSIPLDLFHPQ